MKHFNVMKIINWLGLLILGFSFVSCVFAQDSLQERLRERQKRRSENPQSYISNVPNTVQKSFDFENIKRTFLVHTPPKYDGKTPLSLVLCFHGGVGTGKEQEQKTGFSSLADKENFIVVYPDGYYNQWNDGRGSAFLGSPNTNDVGFVTALIEFMEKNYRIDAKRVYATGGSNGGIFTNRLGVELSDKLAAIAPVVGNLPIDPQTNKPIIPTAEKTKSLSVLMINGTDDTFVKWQGGIVRGSSGRVTSVAETVAAWTQLNGCKNTPKIENLPDKFPDDGTTVRRESYTDCKENTQVILYAVVGGGHGWHGSTATRGGETRNLTGNLSQEINSTEIIWEFFKNNPKK